MAATLIVNIGFIMPSSHQLVNDQQQYHAHLYFDETSFEKAKGILQAFIVDNQLPLGNIHEKLVGPHLKWSCQIKFNNKQFDSVVNWFNANRQGLSVLIHGDTGFDLKDHTTYAQWLGDIVDINLEYFDT